MNQSWRPDPSFLQGIDILRLRILLGGKSGALPECGTIYISMSFDLAVSIKKIKKGEGNKNRNIQSCIKRALLGKTFLRLLDVSDHL